MRRPPLAFTFFLSVAVGCSSSASDDDDGSGSAGPDAGSEAVDFAPGCPSVRSEVNAIAPTIMLLVDRSGTMTRGFGGTNRWNAVYGTLMDDSTGLVRKLDDKVSFGLALYSGEDGNPTCPIINQVDPAMGNYAAINAEFTRRSPLEDTPTGESINALTDYLSKLPDTGPKAIVLATDGEPDTCADPDPDGQPAAKALAVEATERAFQAGIETHVISVGDQVSDGHLQDMANAGVGLPGTGNAPFYRALSANDLEDAFDSIVAGVRGCSFELDEPVAIPDSGKVTLDGRPLDMGSDWKLTGDATLELIGAACDEVLDGEDHAVEAVFECGGDGQIVL